MENKKIAILGAAGFVGIELINQLELEPNIEVYAITRDNGDFLLGDKKVLLLKEASIDRKLNFDVVVNLAYPTTNIQHSFPKANSGILQTLKKIVKPKTKIIHVSTQAVFGFAMDQKVVFDFLRDRRDYAYVEAKLQMENLINRTFPDNNVTILRLGNVWGAGSGSWTGAIIERLLFGQLVAVEGIDGYSNITDIKNVAAYIIFLLKSESTKEMKFHHLAEFSHVKWSQLISLLAIQLKVKPVLSDVNPINSTSLKSDIRASISFPKVGNIYRKLVWGRKTGSYLRSIVRFLGVSRFSTIKKTETKVLPKTSQLSNADSIYLTIVSTNVEFKNHINPGFVPLVNFQESWKNVKNWMNFAGFTNE
jgi:nucleoside-diphosphate-sugar epimerase